jgi:uncharacterized protein (UPF0305 family)
MKNTTRLKRRLWIDFAMLAIAVFSVALLVIDLLWPALIFEQERQTWLLTRLDWGICGIFFAEFVFRLARSDRKGRFVLQNWYDILGMILFSHPALRGFRLLRFIRVVGTLMRLRRGLDRVFGEGYAVQLVRRYKNILVEVVSDAVILRVLSMVKTVVNKGQCRASIQQVIEARRGMITGLVKRNLNSSRTLATLERLPFAQSITSALVEEVTDVVIAIISDQQFEQVIRETIDAIMKSIMDEVAKLESASRASWRENSSK